MKKIYFLLLFFPYMAFATTQYSDEDIIKASKPSLYYTSINLSVNPVENFNQKSKEDILNIRNQYMATSYFQSQMPYAYTPSPAIFGQIKDGKMWKSIFAYHCSNVDNADDTNGNSYVSRDINNPDILVGLSRSLSIHVNNKNMPHWFCDENQNPDALPSLIYYHPEYNILSIEYTLDKRILQHSLLAQYTLSDLNARDFGYNAIYILKNNNIVMVKQSNITRHIGKTKDYIHVGMNCTAPGGCNNTSPSKPEMNFKIQKLPADMLIKLWKNNPQSPQQPADMYVRLVFKPK